MIEKIKSVYGFKNVHEITEILNSLNSSQRPYQYALLDPETNPLLTELRKINNKIETVFERIDAIEKGQKDIREALGIICNQTHLSRHVSSSQTQRGRNSDFHS